MQFSISVMHFINKIKYEMQENSLLRTRDNE